MDVLTSPGKRYRRYRHENRYNSPLLIFIADTSIAVVKLGLVVTLLWIGWGEFKNPRSVKAEPATEIASSTANASTASDTAAEDLILNVSTATKDITTATPVSSQSEFAISKPAATRETSQSDLPVAGSATETTLPVITNEDWILGMQPSTYTIQFGASNNIALFETFIPVINTGEPISIYPYKLSATGKPIYGIASGVYTSSSAASAAVELFSAEARAFKPWIRKAADLTFQIESVKKKIQAGE